MIDKLYNDKFKKVMLGRIECNDIIDIIIVIIEHEIIYLILFLYNKYKNDVKSD
jgi:hypothetical protein